MKRIIRYNKFITESFGDKIIEIAKSDMDLARQLAISQDSTLEEIFKLHFSKILDKEFVIDVQSDWYVVNGEGDYSVDIKFKISDLKINQEDEIELYCEVDKSSYIFVYDEKYSLEEIFDNLDLSDFYNSYNIINELRSKRKYHELDLFDELNEKVKSKITLEETKELEEFYIQLFYKCY